MVIKGISQIRSPKIKYFRFNSDTANVVNKIFNVGVRKKYFCLGDFSNIKSLFFRHILVSIHKVKEKMFRTFVRTFIYHFVINFLSASLIFPNTQNTKSVIENIAIGKYRIIIKIMEGKRDPD